MNNMNQLILEGVVEKAPVLGGTAEMDIAVSRNFKDMDGNVQEEKSFFTVRGYGNLADIMMRYCPKGRGVMIVGRLKQERWKDSDGKEHSKVVVLAEHIDLRPVKEEK